MNCSNSTDSSNAHDYYNDYRRYCNTTLYESFPDYSSFFTELLMYKEWITIKQWLRYLYIKRIKRKIYSVKAFQSVLLIRKTNRSTTPIRRYKPGNRK